jgi:hypothetical protein
MKNLDKILSLIAKTGDKFITSSPDGDFVIMSLMAYESLLNKSNPNLDEMSEDELIDKINEEIAEWREGQTNNLDNPFDDEVKAAFEANSEEKKSVDDQYYLEPVD